MLRSVIIRGWAADVSVEGSQVRPEKGLLSPTLLVVLGEATLIPTR